MRPWRAALPLWTLLFASAFVAEPNSCEWGLAAYTWAGGLGALGLGALPLLVPSEATPLRRFLIGLGLSAGTVCVWLAGLFIANVQLICRLF